MVPTRVMVASLAILLSILFYPSGINAHHSWGKYHWARTSNPLRLNVGDNTTGSSGWSTRLNNAIGDWNSPVGGWARVVALTGVAGQSSSPDCNPVVGRIEVCNGDYGQNGWLGIAQIWTGGGFHIAQATTKLNDTYFNTSQYDTAAWRQLVVCQEIAHGFGLDHQDENFNNTNLGTCMDYTSDPDGTLADPDQLSNVSPNAHDFEQLVTIYTHLDGTGGSGGGGNGRGRQGGFGDIFPSMPQNALEHVPDQAQSSWGRMISNNGRVARFLLDLGNGNLIHTFVIWA
jgi:hypothetical protein